MGILMFATEILYGLFLVGLLLMVASASTPNWLLALVVLQVFMSGVLAAIAVRVLSERRW